MSEIKLKPCPFCGGKAEIKQLMYQHTYPQTATTGRTINCECGMQVVIWWAIEDFQAAEAWNRRSDNA